MSKSSRYTIKDRLELIAESIELIISRCENIHTANSDIDIVVELEKPSLRIMYDLRENLKEVFGCDVDLVRFRDSLRPLLKHNIQNEAVYV